MIIDGYKILRELHASKRSEVFLALDDETGQRVALKTPSINYRDDAAYLEGFLHEEWVGRRIRNAHILNVLEPRNRHFLYNVTEYVEGAAWSSGFRIMVRRICTRPGCWPNRLSMDCGPCIAWRCSIRI